MTSTAPLPHPGVRFPPPLLFVLGLGVGWLLHTRWPLPIGRSSEAPRDALAALCLAVWLGLFLWALATFRRARTTMIPNRPASSFVTDGPYRFTRNPMYVSLVALYAGVTLLVNSWWPALLLPLVLLAVYHTIIAREERYLSGAFPAEYADYRRRVRRWL
jgi:protein-S-isoprenylcysteine O-methyltransferase Ste14